MLVVKSYSSNRNHLIEWQMLTWWLLCLKIVMVNYAIIDSCLLLKPQYMSITFFFQVLVVQNNPMAFNKINLDTSFDASLKKIMPGVPEYSSGIGLTSNCHVSWVSYSICPSPDEVRVAQYVCVLCYAIPSFSLWHEALFFLKTEIP